MSIKLEMKVSRTGIKHWHYARGVTVSPHNTLFDVTYYQREGDHVDSSTHVATLMTDIGDMSIPVYSERSGYIQDLRSPTCRVTITSPVFSIVQ